MKKLGIWIDKRVAHIVIQDAEGNQELNEVYSQIEEYNVKGGSGTAMKGGPQDVVQDRKYLEREKHQFKEYVKDILVYLKNADQILIFGPAETGQRLQIELENSYHDIASRIKAVIKADIMTQNKIKAFVRDFYKTTPGGRIDL